MVDTTFAKGTKLKWGPSALNLELLSPEGYLSALTMTRTFTLTRNLTQTLSLKFACKERTKYYDLNAAKCYLRYIASDGSKQLTRKVIRQMCKNEKYAGATYDDWVQQGRFVPARTAYVIVNGDGTLTLSSKEGMPRIDITPYA